MSRELEARESDGGHCGTGRVIGAATWPIGPLLHIGSEIAKIREDHRAVSGNRHMLVLRAGFRKAPAAQKIAAERRG